MPVCSRPAAVYDTNMGREIIQRRGAVKAPPHDHHKKAKTKPAHTHRKADMPSSSFHNSALPPFLKWAGGKRWLIHQASEIFPEKFNTYIEPFLGSGAVFFHLKPEKAILGDVNKELINTYSAIKADWQLVYRYLKEHQRNHSSDYFYKLRGSSPRSIYTEAARMIYLNRTCWNGLYRVNKKGQFNVPIGTKTRVLLDTDNFEGIATRLRKTELLWQDFGKTLASAKDGDFVFVDPPYTVNHNMNGFIKYNENLFSWDDQIRLRDSIDSATERGAKVLILNADHECIHELYQQYPARLSLTRASVIAGKASSRGTYGELAIQCWAR